jgi:signal transduction histidine kinase
MKLFKFISVFFFISAPLILFAELIHHPVADSGVIDVREVDFDQEGLIKLDGAWKFYPEQFVSYGDLDFSNNLSFVYDTVPGFWGNDVFGVKNKSGKGFGTYHLAIITQKNNQDLGFRIPPLYSASIIYLNDNLVVKNGVFADDFSVNVPVYRPIYSYFENQNDTIHLFIQISNYHHRLGGLGNSIVFGKSEVIKNKERSYLINDMMKICVFFIATLMFIILFFYRSKEYFYLYFALFSFFSGIRTAVMNEMLLSGLFNFNFLVSLRVEYFTFYLLVITLVIYVYTLFPIPKCKLFIRILSICYLFLALISLFVPMYLLSWIVQVSKIIILFTVVYGFVYVVYIVIKKRNFAWLMVLALLALISAGLVDLIISVYYVYLPNYSSFIAIFVFVIIQIILLSKRYAQSLSELEDITDDLKHVNENLEKIVTTRTRQINQQKFKLEEQKQKLQVTVNTKNKLFSIIGHDLRSPIGIAYMYAENLLEEDSLTEDQQEMVRYISESSSTALHLLNNLLMWGKSETGKIKFSPIYFDIQELILESVEQFQGTLIARQITVTVEAENQIIFADRFMILLVLNNMLSNAIKFSETGAAILIKVESIGSGKEKAIKVSVSDRGVGINADMLEKILTPDNYITTRGVRNEKGSGLGLKICMEFVRQNSGVFNMESVEGEGTTVSFTIPIKRWN